MGPTVLFGTIHGSHCTISFNFYLYLQYIQKKVFNFSKISGSQINTSSVKFLIHPFLASGCYVIN